MNYTAGTIRFAFECNAPDAYFSFYEAVREILQCDTTCQTFQLQEIQRMLDAAESGRKAADAKRAALTEEGPAQS